MFVHGETDVPSVLHSLPRVKTVIRGMNAHTHTHTHTHTHNAVKVQESLCRRMLSFNF